MCVCVCEGGIGSRKRLFSSFIILGGNEVRMILSQKKRLPSAWSRHGCGRCCPGLWNILLSISISSRLPFHSLVLNIFLQSSPLYACTSINVFPCNQGFYRRLKEKQCEPLFGMRDHMQICFQTQGALVELGNHIILNGWGVWGSQIQTLTFKTDQQ